MRDTKCYQNERDAEKPFGWLFASVGKIVTLTLNRKTNDTGTNLFHIICRCIALKLLRIVCVEARERFYDAKNRCIFAGIISNIYIYLNVAHAATVAATAAAATSNRINNEINNGVCGKSVWQR